jgi:pimeloyl-ACP methyl ester carboxylesterase
VSLIGMVTLLNPWGDRLPHSIAQPLAWGNRTYAHFALGNCDTLLLLVHGFGGGAASTWRGLQSLANEMPDTDIVSYGYNSTNAPAANSAVLLGEFIDAMLGNAPAWAEIVARVTRSPARRDYARLVIVAHSLGAAVARRTLLNAIKADAEWPRRARLILFAPAHMGTRLLSDRSMLQGGLGGLVSTLLVAWKLGRPTIDDLTPNSSFLQSLIDETNAYLTQGWGEPLKAKQVLFGEKETVVRVDRFCEDPTQKVWVGHDHVSVCKVKEAADFVRENLK